MHTALLQKGTLKYMQFRLSQLGLILCKLKLIFLSDCILLQMQVHRLTIMKCVVPALTKVKMTITG